MYKMIEYRSKSKLYMQIVNFFMLGLNFKGITASQYILINSKLFVKNLWILDCWNYFSLVKLFSVTRQWVAIATLKSSIRCMMSNKNFSKWISSDGSLWCVMWKKILPHPFIWSPILLPLRLSGVFTYLSISE